MVDWISQVRLAVTMSSIERTVDQKATNYECERLPSISSTISITYAVAMDNMLMPTQAVWSCHLRSQRVLSSSDETIQERGSIAARSQRRSPQEDPGQKGNRVTKRVMSYT